MEIEKSSDLEIADATLLHVCNPTRRNGYMVVVIHGGEYRMERVDVGAQRRVFGGEIGDDGCV